MHEVRDDARAAICGYLLALVAAAMLPSQASAQAANDAATEANNPLTPKITVNFQDQWAARLYDSDDDLNSFLLRSTIPHKLGGAPQILRATLPVVTAPDAPGGSTTGLGDLNLFDLVLFKHGSLEFGVGPQLTIPTASHDALGTGKWQAGIATVVIAPQPWGLFGLLVTWQHSFAGDDDRPTQNNVSAQPLVIFNLPNGWYLRSTASWNFDVKRGNYAIPIGLGVGKVWLMPDKSTLNAFVEPQWTVSHDGAGQPKFQVFAGINLQFPIGH